MKRKNSNRKNSTDLSFRFRLPGKSLLRAYPAAFPAQHRDQIAASPTAIPALNALSPAMNGSIVMFLRHE